jgi:VPDSG-CTERM motif
MPRGENMKKVIAVLCFVLMALAASQASATTLTYAITSDHCSGGCGTGSTVFGYVVLTDGQAVDTVLVTVTMNSGYQFVETGGTEAHGISGVGAFNITSNPTITESAFSTDFGPGFVTGGSGYSRHMDGAGDFMYTVLCPGCGSGGGGRVNGPLSFIVGATGIDPYSFIANTPDGNIFAFDIYSVPTDNTGVVDVSTAPVVPDGGATAALLGLAMVGLGFVRRFRR